MKRLISIVLTMVLILGVSWMDFSYAAEDEDSVGAIPAEQQDIDAAATSSDSEDADDSLIGAETGDPGENDGEIISFIDLPERFEITPDQVWQIPATLSDDINMGDVEWTSSDASFTVYSYGYIWSVVPGVCTVTARVPSKGIEDSCTVVMYPTGISPSEKTIGKNESFSCSLYTNASVTYYSSNPKIATVNSTGGVKGKSKGTCYINAVFLDRTYQCKVTVLEGLNYTYVELYKGEKFKLKVYGVSKLKWKSSKKSVVTVSSGGVLKGKKNGSATITAKKNGKTYKCKVKVVYREPDFGACLDDYNTRGNYFVVRFCNKGSKTLTITAGSKVEDIDYKTFDRKIKLKKKIKIKPGTTKNVRFYVKGRTTWYNYQDFTLHYKFSYDGKTRVGHVWDEDSVYKKGKSWYSTYWDEDWYENWY